MSQEKVNFSSARGPCAGCSCLSLTSSLITEDDHRVHENSVDFTDKFTVLFNVTPTLKTIQAASIRSSPTNLLLMSHMTGLMWICRMRKELKLDSDGTNSGSKDIQTRIFGGYGGVRRCRHLAGIWNETVGLVLISFEKNLV